MKNQKGSNSIYYSNARPKCNIRQFDLHDVTSTEGLREGCYGCGRSTPRCRQEPAYVKIGLLAGYTPKDMPGGPLAHLVPAGFLEHLSDTDRIADLPRLSFQNQSDYYTKTPNRLPNFHLIDTKSCLSAIWLKSWGHCAKVRFASLRTAPSREHFHGALKTV